MTKPMRVHCPGLIGKTLSKEKKKKKKTTFTDDKDPYQITGKYISFFSAFRL
jgi:hypothetical protein